VHEPRAEHALGLVLVVRPAQQPQILDRRLPAACHRLDVVELHVATAFAAPAALRHERAAPLVALPDRALDGIGDVTAVRGPALLPGSVGGAEAALLEGLALTPEALRQRLAHLLRRHLPPGELLEVADRLARRLLHREPGLVAARAQRRHFHPRHLAGPRTGRWF